MFQIGCAIQILKLSSIADVPWPRLRAACYSPTVRRLEDKGSYN